MTPAGIAVATAADAAAQRDALELGTMATEDASSFTTAESAWTDIVLSLDSTTSSASAVDVASLAFTPVTNVIYEFYAVLLLRASNAAIGPRVGLAWATGGTDGVASIVQSTAATTQLLAAGNISASLLIPSSTLADNTGSWPCIITGMFQAGATPSGTVKIQLATSTAATNVTMKAGSIFRYRSLA